MTTYYVAPSGNDGASGSKANPIRTLGEVSRRLTSTADPSGTVVRFREGTYELTSGDTYTGVTGSADEPIVWEAYADEDVTIDLSGAAGGTWDSGLQLRNCRHWVIRGLTFRNSPGYGLYLSGSSVDVRLENCTVHDCGNTGVYFYLDGMSARRNRVVGCESYRNWDGNENADGFAVGRADSDGAVLFVDCVSHHNADDGFDLWGTHNTRIESCFAYRNGYESESATSATGNGGGFKLSGNGRQIDGGRGGGNMLVSSVAYDNGYVGVIDNGNDHPHRVYNVTSCGNDYENFAFWDTADEIRNCISHGGDVGLGNTVDDRYNTWNLGITDPGFRSMEMGGPNFLRLSEGSPCLDAGVDVGFDSLEFSGDAPDLGAYQRTLEDSTAGRTVYYHDGSGWRSASVYRHDGTKWRSATVRYHDGTSFT